MKKFAMTILTVMLLTLLAILGISGTAFGADQREERAEVLYYQTVKEEYIRQIKTLLEENGYRNCGVVMNRVTEADGLRKYTVTIHHRRISSLSDDEKSALAKECGTVAFPVENCNISHEFLETDL